ncbi:TIGR04219 family outer membrane beta-barrel protein [Hahella sp. SMD15-11]|uniref:TIGR04219 family outer membrane beta-barrel protein n=1 Tax=Thermohahella caldifontis TaxID=3142973 RepID=A0AB39V069_9GAMM
MKLKHTILALSCAAALAPAVRADTLGLFAGVSGWMPSYNGTFTSNNNDIDMEKDLGFDDSTFVTGYVAFEHPVPALPNLRLGYTELSETAKGTLTKTFRNVSFSGDVTTEFDLTHTDLTAYWRLLDNVVNLDLGLQAKFFDGMVRVEQTLPIAKQETVDVNEVLPLVYVGAGVDLPFTGLSANASVAGIGYSGNRLLDVNANIKYEINVVGIEAGYRSFDVVLDDVDDVDFDVRIGGPYLGAFVHF